MSEENTPTWPCPFCDATGERVGGKCAGCNGEGEIERGLFISE